MRGNSSRTCIRIQSCPGKGLPKGGSSGEVAFVEEEYQFLVAGVDIHEDIVDAAGEVFLRAGDVKHGKDDGGFADLFEGALDADFLDGFGSLADAGGVDETEEDAVDGHGFLDGVAGGAVDIGNDGAVFAEKGVQEGALAGVGGADDDDGNTVFDDIAEAEGFHEGGNMPDGGLQEGVKFVSVGKCDIFFAEVKLQFHKGNNMKHLRTHLGQFAGESAFELVDCNAVGSGILGGYEVGNGFGLGKVHLAVQEGAAGELSRLCGAGSGLDEQAHQAVGYVLGGVAGNLHGVLAGIGMRSTENAHKDFIEEFSGFVLDGAEPDGIAF